MEGIQVTNVIFKRNPLVFIMKKSTWREDFWGSENRVMNRAGLEFGR